MSESSEEEFIMEDGEPETPVKKESKKRRSVADQDDDEDFVGSPDVKPKKKKKSSEVDKRSKAKKKVAVKPEPVASASVGKMKRKKEEDDNDKSPKKAKGERQLKKLDKTERLQYAMQSFLWWEAPVLGVGMNWSTMEHAGVAFPEEYQPHGVKMLYDGQPVDLTPEQEEAATFFAATDPDGMHLGNPKTAPIFIKNFFADFREILGKKHIIKDFKKCDFEPIRKHLNEQKIIRKAISDKERQANKYVFLRPILTTLNTLPNDSRCFPPATPTGKIATRRCTSTVTRLWMATLSALETSTWNLPVPFVAVESTPRWESSNLACRRSRCL